MKKLITFKNPSFLINIYSSKILIYFLFIFIGFSTICCDESVLDENPPNIVTSNSLFRNLSGFDDALNGLYALVRLEKSPISGSATINQMTMNGTDALVTNHVSSGFAGIAQDWGGVNNPSNQFYADAFTWLYSVINTANNIISEAENNLGVNWSGGTGTEEENKNRVIAEARSLRAWAYRHLTYGWGDVPLNLEPSSGEAIRSDWERASVDVVRKQMINDWRFAERFLPVEPRLRGTITKGAVQHFLSEIYLAQNRPDSALFYANEVIETPNYKLITDRYGVKVSQPGIAFMDMFEDGNINRDEGNTEALWVFQFQRNTIGGGRENNTRRDHHSRYVNINVNGVSPLQVTIDRGGRGFGRMSLTKWAIENYESQDVRGSHFAIRKFFILKDEIQNSPAPSDRLPDGFSYGDTIQLDFNQDISVTNRSVVGWPWCRKVDWADPVDIGGSPSFKDFIYLRLAETILLKAEAQFKLGDLSGAVESINQIRSRSNASLVSSSDLSIDFILDERARELVTEEHRRYTLLRTGKWIERTREYNNNGGQLITDKDVLFPIPQVVIDANINQNMIQNQGY